MGMFNYVAVEMPLDGPAPQSPFADGHPRDYQTKDRALGDLTMTTIKVAADGTLTRKVWDMEDTGRWFNYDFDKPLNDCTVWVEPPTDEFTDSLNGPYPERVRVNERWVPVKFTGEFEFHGSTEDGSWVSYCATAVDGVVTDIRITNSR